MWRHAEDGRREVSVALMMGDCVWQARGPSAGAGCFFSWISQEIPTLGLVYLRIASSKNRIFALIISCSRHILSGFGFRAVG